jgi:uncharacterized protein
MERVTFRLYAELNDFLPPERRMAAIPHAVFLPASVKDVIESLGVPHTEVGLILVNSEPVEFTHLVRDGDYISVLSNLRIVGCVLSSAIASATRRHPLRSGHSSWPACDLSANAGL